MAEVSRRDSVLAAENVDVSRRRDALSPRIPTSHELASMKRTDGAERQYPFRVRIVFL